MSIDEGDRHALIPLPKVQELLEQVRRRAAAEESEACAGLVAARLCDHRAGGDYLCLGCELVAAIRTRTVQYPPPGSPADAVRAAVAAEAARCAALVRQLAEPYRAATAQPPPEGSLAGLRAAVLLRAAEAIERGPSP